MHGLPEGPLTVPSWILAELSSAADGTVQGRRTRADMGVMGLGHLIGIQATLWSRHVHIIDRMLADHSREFLWKVRRHLSEHPSPEHDYAHLRIDPVTSAALEGMSTSIAGVTMLTRCPEDRLLMPAGADEAHTMAIDIVEIVHEGEQEPFLLVTLPLGGGLTWEVDRIHGITSMPDTIAAGIAGAPLRDVVSHPLLDAMPLRVREWDGETLRVEIDGRAARVFP